MEPIFVTLYFYSAQVIFPYPLCSNGPPVSSHIYPIRCLGALRGGTFCGPGGRENTRAVSEDLPAPYVSLADPQFGAPLRRWRLTTAFTVDRRADSAI